MVCVWGMESHRRYPYTVCVCPNEVMERRCCVCVSYVFVWGEADVAQIRLVFGCATEATEARSGGFAMCV